ncbi:MAG: fluoride efflux transporter CrcB [Ferrimicrobium sp.]|uniref:Fluoride-specific ion channel FluC n=1 Tax=Ferrimicrobium acidiphilum TaxID=121039 RepID=A0ABV3XYV1_9ACTN|nr:fluoride efflux transporter CrcB [Ferrimicrobium sp.]MCL5973519.1 fluoride efflux transporter CrcB [Actinomycetota bacterium]
MIWLLVAIFGALGAVTRYVLDRLIMSRLATDFPIGTLVINLSGALALGIVIGLATRHVIATDVVVAIGDGFIGAYTTFSTLTFETLSLVSSGSLTFGGLNMFGTVIAASGLAYLGIHLAH